MPALRLKTPHISVMFKLKRSVSASNEESNICHHFLQVAHWERLSCQIAVSIWSPNSWMGKRRHSGHWLLGQACGQAGRTRSQGSKTQSLHQADFKPSNSRSHVELMATAFFHLSYIMPGDIWNKIQCFPHTEKKFPTILTSAERNAMPDFCLLRSSKYIFYFMANI